MKKYSQKGKGKKAFRKEDDFVAPDGGWGWLVCFAAGLTNLCAFPLWQQFGLILRDRLIALGFNNSEITTLINVNSALSACTGLLNGPMFRAFSYRQVAIFGTSLIAIGIFLTSIADSFLEYIISFSILYGMGMGLNISASALALNTYFKNNRRKATGFSWSITAIGPIIMPYVTPYFTDNFGVQGGLMIISSISLHSVACSLIYQPVSWHVKRKLKRAASFQDKNTLENLCEYCKMIRLRNSSVFSSQYLLNADDENNPGYEITDPGTPMMTRANDGWFSSKTSLSSSQTLRQRRFSGNSLTLKENPIQIEIDKTKETEEEQTIPFDDKSNMFRTNSFNFEKQHLKSTLSQLEIFKNRKFKDGKYFCTCSQKFNFNTNEENIKFHKKIRLTEDDYDDEEKNRNEDLLKEDETNCKVTFLQKLIIFFDLDLLKDTTFVILMLGITIAHFAEVNFSILTPFILTDFGYTRDETALAMSLLGGMDAVMRFVTPFVAERLDWDNQTFLLLGISGLAIGRIILSHFRSFTVVLIACVWIGFNKALRTVFMALIIPSYVPLDRLPAASGLQLLSLGLISFMGGPIVGLIRDNTNYKVTLHCLNIATFITIVSWSLEKLYRSCKRKS